MAQQMGGIDPIHHITQNHHPVVTTCPLTTRIRMPHPLRPCVEDAMMEMPKYSLVSMAKPTECTDSIKPCLIESTMSRLADAIASRQTWDMSVDSGWLAADSVRRNRLCIIDGFVYFFTCVIGLKNGTKARASLLLTHSTPHSNSSRVASLACCGRFAVICGTTCLVGTKRIVAVLCTHPYNTSYHSSIQTETILLRE